MQLINLNYSWKKEFKQIKSSQEKLSQRWTFCAQIPLNFRINLLKIKIRKQHKKYFVVHLESFNPIWNGGGGQSKNTPLTSFLKYLQNDERYDFSLLWLLVTTYFERFCQISCDNFDCLTSHCDFVRRVPKNSKKNFFSKIFSFEATFFAKYFQYTLCWSGKYGFFHLKSHFLISIWK